MLATIAKLKKSMQIPDEDSSQDDQLQFLILAASQAIEQYCNRSFKRQEHTEVVSVSGTHYITVRNYPVIEVLEILTPFGTLADYQVLDQGILYRKRGWPAGNHHLRVTYKAGYVLPGDATPDTPRTLPEDLELACILLCQTFTRAPGVSAERVGDLSVSYANEGEDLPFAVKSLINPYRRWQ